MKSKFISILLFTYFLSTVFSQITLAQDYTELNLPRGAKKRLGKGVIIDMQISPNNKRFAITSRAGVWLYDVSTRTQNAPLIRFDNVYVSKIIFSTDSKLLAIDANGDKIHIWHTDSGQSISEFKRPIGKLESLNFSPDSKTLLCQNRKGTVQFWNVNTEKQIATFKPDLPKLSPRKYKDWTLATDYYVDHSGEVVFAIANKDGTISLRSSKTNNEIRKLVTQNYDSSALPIQYSRPYNVDPDIDTSIGKPYIKWVSYIKFAPDGKTLVSIFDYRRAKWSGWEGQGGGVELWDVSTGKQLAIFPWDVNITFSGDSKSVAISDRNELTHIWDIPTRTKIAEYAWDKNVHFSGDGKTLVVVGKSGYTLWDIFTQQDIATNNPITEWLEFVPDRFVLSYDGTLLATADKNGVVALWETKSSKQLRSLSSDFSNPYTALTFSHDGRLLVSGDAAGKIQLWDLKSSSKLNTIDTKRIGSLVFSEDNASLISESELNSKERSIEVWNVSSGKRFDFFTIPNSRRNVYFAGFDDMTFLSLHEKNVFTPDGEKLAIETTEGIAIWDVKTKSHLNTIKKDRNYAYVAALSSDGKLLAASIGSVVRLWDTQTGKHTTLKPPRGLKNSILDVLGFPYYSIYTIAFGPDDKILAAAGRDKNVYLWDIPTKRRIATLKNEHAISQLAFSPNGKILACGDSAGKIYLWNYTTNRHLITYDASVNFVSKLTFAPDGKTIASVCGGPNGIGYNSGTIFLWNVPIKQ